MTNRVLAALLSLALGLNGLLPLAHHAWEHEHEHADCSTLSLDHDDAHDRHPTLAAGPTEPACGVCLVFQAAPALTVPDAPPATRTSLPRCTDLPRPGLHAVVATVAYRLPWARGPPLT